MPFVSIGMPVYNGEKYVSVAIESILSQTFTDFELVISDNDSSDNTKKICKEYLRKDSRIKLFENDRNIGATLNYNKVFSYAKGKYFKWAAHDDYCAPKYLERCVEILEKNQNASICYTRSKFINLEGVETIFEGDRLHLQSESSHDRLSSFLTTYNLCMPITGLIRYDTLKKTGLIAPYIGSDFILLVELCLLGTFFEVPETLFYRREHNYNVRRLPPKERAKWFDPEYKGIVHLFPAMLLFSKLLSAITHSSIPLAQKMKCYPQVARWVLRKWRDKGGKYKAVMKKEISKRYWKKFS